MSDDDKLRNSLRPGHELHWYRIEEVLGQGGFGITYLAYDANLEQHVAIKEYLPMELAVREGDFSVYPASRAHDTRYRWGLDRFLAEARTLARFKHPAIVRVNSVFEANNTAYMVMEYQHGMSLQAVLERRGTLPESELVALVMPLLDGLQIIHAEGFIHRDIKPSNIYIRRDGHPVLLDFGSARQALGEETKTLTSVVSPGYAPFEQYYSKSDRQGPWTDIYGLGATLYRALSGLQPMAAIDRSEAILKAERDVFVSAAELGSGRYSPSFLRAVDAALVFNEKKRPQNVAEWRRLFAFNGNDAAAPRTPAMTSHPPEAETRYSGVVEQTQLLDAPVVNADVRGTRGAQASSARSAQAARAPASAAAAPSARPRRWPWVVLVLLVLFGGGIGYAWQAGLLPAGLLDFNRGARLVQQGDRALAAGQVFEPQGSSALDFYRQAWAASPGDVDAGHGLRITGERLAAAIDAAIADGDGARVDTLSALLAGLPPAAGDFDALRERVAGDRARRQADALTGERIRSLLADAAADVEAGRLVGNDAENALARYRAVQVLDPDNAAARDGLVRLGAALAARGQSALAAGRLEQAREWHGQGTLLDAEHADIVALGEALADARGARERAATVDELLTAAGEDIEANRLTSPPGRNALERYKEVERLDPGNADAAAGVRRVHDRYLAMGTQALARDAFDDAAEYARRALEVRPDSEPARTLGAEIRAAAQRRREAADELLAEQAAARAAQMRAAAEQARRAAETERQRAQEAEAARLAAEAERKAEEQRLARLAEERARAAAENARPRLVLDYAGFHPKYAVHGLTRDSVEAAVAPLLRASGYDIVKRDEVHDAGWSWNNLRLLVFRLSVNENTATGLYSWAVSLNVLDKPALRLSLPQAMETPAEWTRSRNGLGPPTDLQQMVGLYREMSQAWLANRPGRVR